jgi:replicative DNA helicase
MTEHQMPANEQAEKSILGGILQNNGLFYQAAGLLSQTFSLSAHSSIWEAMCDLHAMGQPIDIVTLPEQLEKRGKLESVNGTAYLMELTMGLPERTSIEVWVKLVRDKAYRRWLIEQCQLAEARLYDSSIDTADCMAVMEDAALRVRADAGVKSSHHISEIVPEVITELENIRKREGLIGFTTGVPCVDRSTTGIRPDEYWVIGARPSRGKTVLGVQIAAANAMLGVPVLAFSFEMTRRQFVRRMIPNHSEIPAFKVRDPRYMSASEMDDARACGRRLEKLPLWVVDPDGMKSSELTSAAKFHIHRHGVKLIVVDYLQIIRGPQRELKERVAACSNALRSIPKTEGVPVVVLSQLRRLDDENGIPSMADLKETGDIEAHAHTILLLSRPKNDRNQWSGNDQIIIAKQREGLVGSESVTLNESRLAFFDRTGEIVS